jgi:hypothetical protein
MKQSSFDSSRFWAALSVLLLGEFIVLGLLNGDVHLWLNAWRQVIKNGLPGIAATFCLLVVAVLVSRSLAGGIWFLLKSMGGGFQKTGFWLARFLSLVPIHTLAWAFIGLWVGRWGFPIWSLMPVSADLPSLSFLEHLSQDLWTWVPAIFLLCIPLVGQWIVILSQSEPLLEMPMPTPEEVETSLATPHLVSPERIFGQSYEEFLLRTRDRIQLRASMRTVMGKTQSPGLSNPAWGIGLLACLFLFSVEDILGLPGAMAKLVQALRAHAYQAAVTPVLMLSCVAALGTFCAGSPVFTGPTTIRCALSWLFKGAGWSIVIASQLAVTLGIAIPLLPEVDSEMVFTNPMSALWTGLPAMLCALSLWLLGHMIYPSKDNLNHD